MNKVTVKAFKVIGISVRTTNQNELAAQDIGALWHKFMSEKIIDKIPNKIDTTVYSIYTDYESDYTQPYTTILGCKVEHLNEIPNGMVGKSIKGGPYEKFTTKGDLTKGLIINQWKAIWTMDLDREYSADFEVFGEKAQNPQDAEIDILIAVKS
ncbi:GyrI-like domain-containing protein [Olleya sp. Bg11-27]|uniref:GyrI-like domain-containing protein n=1 Tax=Olleya sp. Bg11-27 TaxID=2058135 RepID=UPI000C302D52|nr:GyrI-like domain-containing protein [Olleya sp. Bg11-27]AUC76294.1 AraC family transcriptional regulator [Olleya sp. Bg11-27]